MPASRARASFTRQTKTRMPPDHDRDRFKQKQPSPRLASPGCRNRVTDNACRLLKGRAPIWLEAFAEGKQCCEPDSSAVQAGSSTRSRKILFWKPRAQLALRGGQLEELRPGAAGSCGKCHGYFQDVGEFAEQVGGAARAASPASSTSLASSASR